MKVICCCCNKQAKIVSGNKIYPKRPDLKEKLFWLCECGAYVGCHGNSNKPLGELAHKEVRLLRRKAHNVLDEIWKSKKMQRKEVYQWLAIKLGINYEDCHIGLFDMELCQKVIDIVSRQD